MDQTQWRKNHANWDDNNRGMHEDDCKGLRYISPKKGLLWLENGPKNGYTSGLRKIG